MAPEILNGKSYDFKADMWSIGVTLFELITGDTPYTGNNKQELIDNINKGKIFVPKSLKLSKACLNFLQKSLLLDPASRMTVKEALEHPFVNNRVLKISKEINSNNDDSIDLEDDGINHQSLSY